MICCCYHCCSWTFCLAIAISLLIWVWAFLNVCCITRKVFSTTWHLYSVKAERAWRRKQCCSPSEPFGIGSTLMQTDDYRAHSRSLHTESVCLPFPVVNKIGSVTYNHFNHFIIKYQTGTLKPPCFKVLCSYIQPPTFRLLGQFINEVSAFH